MRIIQVGLLCTLFCSLQLLFLNSWKFVFSHAREKIFIFLITSLSPIFLYLSLFFPGKLESTLAGTNLGVVLQSLILAISSVCVLSERIFYKDLSPVPTSAIFLGTYLTWAAINGLIRHQSWFGAIALFPIIFAIAFGKFSIKDIEFGLTVSLVSITVGALFTSFQKDSLMQCRFDKCLIFTESFNFGGSQNSFSISVSLLGISLMYIHKTLRKRLYIYFITIYLALLGGSRSAIITLSIIGLVLIIETLIKNQTVIWLIMRSTFSLAVLISLVPVYNSFTDDAFTSRGVLWRNAKEKIKENLISGNGQSFWTHQFSSGGFVANYGTHNIWLDNLVSFGLVGLVLFLLTVFSIRKTRERLELNVILAAMFLLGTLESSFQFWKLSNGIPFFVLILLFSKEDVENMEYREHYGASEFVRSTKRT